MLASGNQVSHLIGPNGACPNVPDEAESNAVFPNLWSMDHLVVHAGSQVVHQRSFHKKQYRVGHK